MMAVSLFAGFLVIVALLAWAWSLVLTSMIRDDDARDVFLEYDPDHRRDRASKVRKGPWED